jgi:hypothetical protein
VRGSAGRAQVNCSYCKGDGCIWCVPKEAVKPFDIYRAPMPLVQFFELLKEQYPPVSVPLARRSHERRRLVL